MYLMSSIRYGKPFNRFTAPYDQAVTNQQEYKETEPQFLEETGVQTLAYVREKLAAHWKH